MLQPPQRAIGRGPRIGVCARERVEIHAAHSMPRPRRSWAVDLGSVTTRCRGLAWAAPLRMSFEIHAGAELIIADAGENRHSLIGIRCEAGMRRANLFRAAHQAGRCVGSAIIQEISKTNNPPKNIRALTVPDQTRSPNNWGDLVAQKIFKLGKTSGGNDETSQR
jgi:hypothetical protein